MITEFPKFCLDQSNMKSILISLTLLLTVAFASLIEESVLEDVEDFSGISHRIVGGQIAKPNQFPYQVLVRITKIRDGDIAYYSYCGGSLISDKVVLSAAHCLAGSVAVSIYLGAHNRDEFEDPSRVTIHVNKKENIIVHETFDPELYEDDIGLVILPEKVELNDKINTIALPPSNQGDIVGRMAVTSGWGKTGDYMPASDVLRFVQRKILRNDYCRRFYGPLVDSQICVDGYQRKSICQGDSGGPLVIDEKDGSKMLVGITSFARSDGCEKGVPTVFTRVSSYLDWINKHSGIQFDK